MEYISLKVQQTSKGKIVNDIFSDNDKYYEGTKGHEDRKGDRQSLTLLLDIHMAHCVTSQ